LRASAVGPGPKRPHPLPALGSAWGRRLCLPLARPSCEGERSPSRSPGSPRRGRGRERSPRAQPSRGSAQSAGALAGARRRYGRRSCERPWAQNPTSRPIARASGLRPQLPHPFLLLQRQRTAHHIHHLGSPSSQAGCPDVQAVHRSPETARGCDTLRVVAGDSQELTAEASAPSSCPSAGSIGAQVCASQPSSLCASPGLRSRP